MADMTLGRTFRSQLQWRFLNLLHLAFGPEADEFSRRVYGERQREIGAGLDLVLDEFGELTSDEIERLGVGADVLNSLSDEVLPAVRDLHAIGVPSSSLDLLAWRAVEAADSRFTVLREQLGAWTRRWNLDADWMRDAALQTVSLWAKDQQIHEARMWALPPFDAYLTRESSIELPVWSYASEEGLKAYRKRAREYVLAAVDRHVENLRTSARAEGVPTEIRELDVPSYIWTIRHQLGGEAQNRIAEDVGVDKSRVGKNIRTLLDLLQIPPRVRLGR